MLKHALRYAAEGLHVFPIWPGTKRPMTQHGFHGATTELEQIYAWWEMWPDANIGWDPHQSGHCVVDLDRGHDPFEDVPTYVIRTPSGGEHHIFEGVLPSTTGKLGYHIDTRGGNTGYGLLPPSVIDERDPKAATDPSRRGAYTVKCDHPIAPLSEWVVEKLSQAKSDGPAKPRAFTEIDTPDRIARIRELATAQPGVCIGEGSDNATFKFANTLLDLCSPQFVVEAMWECWVPRCGGEWDENYIRSKVEYLASHVGTGSRKDAVGCDPWRGPKPERFHIRWPHEFEDDLEIAFWDTTKMLPRVDGEGAIVLVYGQYGSHKTNVTLTWIMDIVAGGARVLYAAGEGARGIGKARIPAHCQVRNIPIRELKGKLGIVEAIPLLQVGTDVQAFIKTAEELKPQVVVLDTLATATAGMDENSSEFSAMLTDNGSVGLIKRAFGATVIVIAHEGKDPTRGARGHSGLSGNIDAGLKVSVEGNTVSVFVDKMRDGEDKFERHYEVNEVGVPIPQLISETEYELRNPDTCTLIYAYQEAVRVLGEGALYAAVREQMLKTNKDIAKNSEALRQKIIRLEKKGVHVRTSVQSAYNPQG